MNKVEELFNYEDMEELKTFVENFVKEINQDIKVEFETQFVSSITEKTIYIGLLPLIQGYKSNEDLQEIYKQKGFEYNDFHIFALLHEIGHIESVKDFNDFELFMQMLVYRTDVEELNKNSKNDREFLEKYIELPVEKMANEWALDFYKTNKQKIVDFTKKFYDLFDKLLDTVLD